MGKMDAFNYEKTHLSKVLQQVNNALEKIESVIKKHRERVLHARKYMWDDLPRAITDTTEANELAQGLLDLKRQEDSLAFYRIEKERLERLKRSPYFARIDFKVNNSPEPIYIGINGFNHPETGKNLIYDWRTPIASLFYDYPLGLASYDCDAGTVSGEITLKRQFRIEKGQMLYMFDSSINIEDEILQEILSQNSDGHMREIVMTIQKEQNKAIRDENHRLVLVWGAGGSGKTSIALHRIAYLLYRKREQLKAANIVIYSPSDIFSDYISEVLPDLGEENVNQATLQEYAKKVVNLPEYEIETSFEQYEYLLNDQVDSAWSLRNEAMRFKSSPQFLTLLENYISYLENSYQSVPDFIYNNAVVLSGAEFYSCVKDKYHYLPFKKRLEKLARRLNALLEPLEEKRKQAIIREIELKGFMQGKSDREIQRYAYRKALEETANLKARMTKLISFNLLDSYLELFANLNLLRKIANDLPTNIEGIAQKTLADFKNGFITHEDLMALAFLRQRLESYTPENNIKHLVIDEVQDYSAVELKVLAQTYTDATFTVLGDPNQALLEKGDPRKYVLEALGISDNTVIDLKKSYRSTEEITAFARSFADNPTEIEPVLRKGSKPEVIVSSDPLNELLALLKKRALENKKSVAIITKTYSQANELSLMLKGKVVANKIGENDQVLLTGLLIIPVFLAKGLEFDVAIVWDFNSYQEKEKRLLYIASTRPLHELYLIGTKKGDLLTLADPQNYKLSIN